MFSHGFNYGRFCLCNPVSIFFQKGVRLRFNGTKIRARLGRYSSRKPKAAAKIPYQADVIPLRRTEELWRALGFTLTVGGVSFTLSAINDFERSRQRLRQYWASTSYLFSATRKEFRELSFSDGQKCAISIVVLNAAIFLLWKIKPLEPFMWKWFTNSYASKALCFPMVLSSFSHSHWLHLGVNMYVLYSFTGVSVDRFLGMNQFAAFYITAASFSSLTSLFHKAIMKSPTRALGASGAILSVLAYTCVKIPDARLQIIFVPGFDFSAKTAIIGILLFDLAGLIFRFRMFDHSAHIGGTLFGIFYGLYGEKIIWRDYGRKVINAYRRLKRIPE